MWGQVPRKRVFVQEKNFNWRDPASDPEKARVIYGRCGVLWGDNIEITSLWYEIGEIEELTDEEILKISRLFFRGSLPKFGDVELSRSSGLPGHPVMLQVRGLVTLQPGIKLRGRVCPLFQMERGGGAGQSDPDPINFHDLWQDRM